MQLYKKQFLFLTFNNRVACIVCKISRDFFLDVAYSCIYPNESYWIASLWIIIPPQELFSLQAELKLAAAANVNCINVKMKWNENHSAHI